MNKADNEQRRFLGNDARNSFPFSYCQFKGISACWRVAEVQACEGIESLIKLALYSLIMKIIQCSVVKNACNPDYDGGIRTLFTGTAGLVDGYVVGVDNSSEDGTHDAAAEALECPTIQLVFRERLAGRPWPEVRKLTASNAAKLADIGKTHGVRFQLEPLAWAPLHSLSQSLEVIDEEGANRRQVDDLALQRRGVQQHDAGEDQQTRKRAPAPT